MRRQSPLPMRIVAFPPMLISRVLATSEASPSSSRPCLIHVLHPSPPGAPPSRPYGARVRRYWAVKNLQCRVKIERFTSDRMETCNGSKNSSSRTTPSPPWNFPAPEELSRSPKRCTSTGYRRSSNSTSPIRVFVMCVWTPDVPCQFGPAPEPPAIVCATGQYSVQNTCARQIRTS